MVGIDQLRYVLALWVFLCHGGRPPFLEGHGSAAIWDWADKLYAWSVNGQAAVIGFFIISGLCIHYPNIHRKKINVISFYCGRILRLGLPVAICLFLVRSSGYDKHHWWLYAVPVWTLFCEAIYYAIYPVVLQMTKRGWLPALILVSSVVSFAMIIVLGSQREMNFQEGGMGGLFFWKTALLALPCWLSGLLIAEQFSKAPPDWHAELTRASIWKWRMAAVLLSVPTFPLYRIGLYLDIVRDPIKGLPFASQTTLLLYGIFAFMWLKREVAYHNTLNRPVCALFEKFGKASYSLYLVHIGVIWHIERFFAGPSFPGYLLEWLIIVIAVHIATFLFYIAVEKPSHKAAQKCTGFLKKVAGY
ncbi:hypothetical protein GCM10023212_08880 [Luteolibacter yonseiensis]